MIMKTHVPLKTQRRYYSYRDLFDEFILHDIIIVIVVRMRNTSYSYCGVASLHRIMSLVETNPWYRWFCLPACTIWYYKIDAIM